MKSEIHPEYVQTTIRCVCGAEILTRSTKKDIRVEIVQVVIRSLRVSKSLSTQKVVLSAS